MTRWSIYLPIVLAMGCTHVTERVVLLPSADGHASALVVTTEQGQTELAAPYAVAQVKEGVLTRTTVPQDEVRRRYGKALDAQPLPPRVYTVYFYFETAMLKPESMAMLESIKAELKTMPAAEIIVIGHTDRAGTEAMNDTLSLRRAVVVRDAFLAMGVARRSITVAGQGERAPAVRTADGVPEPRNRRVEVKIR